MQWKAEESKLPFQRWISPPQSTKAASFMAAQEIVKRGKPLTDGEYIKESFMKISYLFSDSKNKGEVALKIKHILLSTKPLEDCALKWQQTSAGRANWWLQCSRSSSKCLWWVKRCKRGWEGSTAVQTWGRSDTEVTLNRWEQKHLISYYFSGKKTKPKTFILDGKLTGFFGCSCASVQLAENLKRTRGQKMGAKCLFC